MKITLFLLSGPAAGTFHEFSAAGQLVIGRGVGATLPLPESDRFISRHHAILEVSPPHCRLRALGRASDGGLNRVLVNGQPVEWAELNDGDELQFGYTRLRVRIEAGLPSQIERQCSGCGHFVLRYPDEAVPELCPDCLTQSRAAGARIHYPARCADCGEDLSAHANRDGRAEELAAVARYLCEACLSQTDDGTGERVGRYRLLGCLGEGTMGAVYRAYDASTCRLWALKRLKHLTGELPLRQRFTREALLQGQQAHPNIVRAIDSGLDEQRMPWLLSEFVVGGDLQSALPGLDLLPPAVVVPLVLGILSGLEYLHAHRIIHRDLKPANILLTGPLPGMAGATGLPVPKISDLGLALCYGAAGGTRLTRPGDRFGTPMFMAPEQIRDARNAREPADLYAVGVMLYYLLTDHYTFPMPAWAQTGFAAAPGPESIQSSYAELDAVQRDRGSSQAARVDPLQLILESDPVPVRQRNPLLGESLAAVVDQAVRKDPAARFGSASAFRIALSAVQ